MTNAPVGRRTHVIRILGKNRDGEILTDVWADIERIGFIVIKTQNIKTGQYHDFAITLRWDDDPDQEGYVTESDCDKNQTRRIHEVLQICDPSASDPDNPTAYLDDPDEWIPIKSLRHLELNQTDIEGGNGTIAKRFINSVLDGTAKGRTGYKMRTYHYDTNFDTQADAAFADNPDLKAYVMKSSDYIRFDAVNGPEGDTKDDTQYVEHEVMDSISHGDGTHQYVNGHDQAIQTRLNNQYLVDEHENAQLNEVGSNDLNPPYRLDPFQNIININFGGLAVEFLDTTT